MESQVEKKLEHGMETTINGLEVYRNIYGNMGYMGVHRDIGMGVWFNWCISE